MKIRKVEAQLVHADGGMGRQTDRYNEANDRFPQFFERA